MKFFILVLLVNNLLFIRDSVCPRTTSAQENCVQTIRNYFGLDSGRQLFPKFAKSGILNFYKLNDQVLVIKSAIRGGIQINTSTSTSGDHVGSSSHGVQQVNSLEELLGNSSYRQYFIGDDVLVTVPDDVKFYFLNLSPHLSNQFLMKNPIEFCEKTYEKEFHVAGSFKTMIENEHITYYYALDYFTHVAEHSTAIDLYNGDNEIIKPMFPATYCRNNYPSYLEP